MHRNASCVCESNRGVSEKQAPSVRRTFLSSISLIDAIPDSGLKEIWESEAIPANDEGGLGSPVVAGGRVYLGVVWHRDVPSETRQIGDLVLRRIGHQSSGNLGKELVAEMTRWLDAQGWSDGVKQQIIAAVPLTQRVADDAVICLDLASGKTLWINESSRCTSRAGGFVNSLCRCR